MSHAKPSRPAPPFSAAVLASARDYVPALIEACGNLNPIEVLLETAHYQAVLDRLDMAEFVVGWFHGVAEAAGGDNVRETYLRLLEATLPAAPAKRSAPATSAPKAKAKDPAPGKRRLRSPRRRPSSSSSAPAKPGAAAGSRGPALPRLTSQGPSPRRPTMIPPMSAIASTIPTTLDGWATLIDSVADSTELTPNERRALLESWAPQIDRAAWQGHARTRASELSDRCRREVDALVTEGATNPLAGLESLASKGLVLRQRL